MRKTFIDTLTDLARQDEKIMLTIGDTGFSVFEDFEAEFKERFINVGIAEQNFVAFSAGLAAMGMKVFAYNVVSFMTLRSMEQIMLDVCYQENPVKLVGVGGGFAYGSAGPTHHSLEDIAMMRTLPGMTVVCPGDPVEMRETVLSAANMDTPIYIRIGRSVDPIVHEQGIVDFKIGKAIQLNEGEDGVLFATGTMLKDAVAARRELDKQGIHIALYSMHTVKPLDEAAIRRYAEKHIPVFTVEEHSVIGGLGGAVAEFLAREGSGTKLHSFGVPDRFAPVTGSREYLNALFGMDMESIVRKIIQVVKEGKN